NDFEVLHYQSYNPIDENSSNARHSISTDTILLKPTNIHVCTVIVRSINDPTRLDMLKGDEVTIMGRYHKLRSILLRYVKTYIINDRPMYFEESSSELDSNAFVCIRLPNFTMPELLEILMKNGFKIETSHCTNTNENKVFIELILSLIE
ncbi:hypothetical protein GJ496_006043, partial [Pomphorhynchus laevis]